MPQKETTKADLYAQAKQLGIKNRSTMNKAELQAAIKKHLAKLKRRKQQQKGGTEPDADVVLSLCTKHLTNGQKAKLVCTNQYLRDMFRNYIDKYKDAIHAVGSIVTAGSIIITLHYYCTKNGVAKILELKWENGRQEPIGANLISDEVYSKTKTYNRVIAHAQWPFQYAVVTVVHNVVTYTVAFKKDTGGQWLNKVLDVKPLSQSQQDRYGRILYGLETEESPEGYELKEEIFTSPNAAIQQINTIYRNIKTEFLTKVSCGTEAIPYCEDDVYGY